MRVVCQQAAEAVEFGLVAPVVPAREHRSELGEHGDWRITDEEGAGA